MTYLLYCDNLSLNIRKNGGNVRSAKKAILGLFAQTILIIAIANRDIYYMNVPYSMGEYCGDIHFSQEKTQIELSQKFSITQLF